LSQFAGEADLVVVPLALRGRKAEFYLYPPVPNVLIHDWLWRSRGQSMVVSWLLLKRLNLVSARCRNGRARHSVRAESWEESGAQRTDAPYLLRA
jgi:hypothetical protein